jgi:predicted PurR-regulated permease PerM
METSSPPWGPTIKLIVGLTIVAIFAALLVRFRDVVGPLLLAMILTYLLHPAVSFISRKSRLPWRTAVNLIYLFFVVLLISLITASGVAVIQQVQNLIRFLETFVTDLPQIVQDLSSRVFIIWIYEIDMQQILGQFDLEQALNQVLDIVQPMLGQAGGLISSVATGTLSAVGWLLFILLISYFTLLDSGQVPDMFSGLVASINLPGYREDLSRLGRSLSRVWNSFMRGQLVLFLATIFIAFLLLTILGVRNALALALLAGFARFVPYVGPFVTWTVTGIVAFFQPSNYFGLEAITFAIVVVGVLLVYDQIIDNIVTPRLYGQVLGVHPAAVLIAAIIAANLLGLIGLLFAAPVLATFLVVGRYAARKMVDLDPWPDEEEADVSRQIPGVDTVRQWILRIRNKFVKTPKRNKNESNET